NVIDDLRERYNIEGANIEDIMLNNAKASGLTPPINVSIVRTREKPQLQQLFDGLHDAFWDADDVHQIQRSLDVDDWDSIHRIIKSCINRNRHKIIPIVEEGIFIQIASNQL